MATKKASSEKGGREQTPTTRAKKSKPLVKNNGKKDNPTDRVLKLQEEVFTLSIEGWTVRQISEKTGLSLKTVISYRKAESQRRAQENAERREHDRDEALAFYDSVIKRAIAKSEMYDALLSGEVPAKVTDHTLDAMIKARERKDKILGLDTPVKVDVGLDAFLDALFAPGETAHDGGGQAGPGGTKAP